MIALPGLGLESLPTGLPSSVVFSGSDLGFGIAPRGVGAPSELAVLDVVGADPAANAELSAEMPTKILSLK